MGFGERQNLGLQPNHRLPALRAKGDEEGVGEHLQVLANSLARYAESGSERPNGDGSAIRKPPHHFKTHRIA